MLGYFPNPYPGETFYSLIARYRQRCGLSAYQPIVHSLFGKHLLVSVNAAAHRLDTFVSKLPPGSTLTADRIIKHHSVLPYCSAFLPQEQLLKTVEAMRKANNNRVLAYLNTKPHLYYCSICAEEQRQQYKEVYWECVPQLPGVYICYKHQVWLEQCQTTVSTTKLRKVFYAAEEEILNTEAQPIEPNEPTHQMLLRIAQNSAWLQTHYFDGLIASKVSDRYRYVLSQKGYVLNNKGIAVNRLFREIQAAYSRDLLQRLGLEFRNEFKTSWLHYLVHTINNNTYKAPLMHIVLVDFLGYSIQEFFQQPLDNPIRYRPCPYLTTTSNISRIDRSPTSHIGAPTPVTVVCDCGFVYLGIEPDQSEGITYTDMSAIEYTEVWRSEFKKDWTNALLGLIDLEGKYKLQKDRLTKLAVEIGLNEHRGSQIAGAARRLARKHLTEEEINNAYDPRYYFRLTWLRILQENEAQSLLYLKRQFQPIYSWLKKNDAKWIEYHLPTDTGFRDTSNLDDHTLASFIRATADELKKDDRLLIRVSHRRLAIICNKPFFTRKFLSDHPLTANALEESIETNIEYAYRKVKAFVLQCRSQGLDLSKGRLRQLLHRFSLSEDEKCKIVDDMMEWVELNTNQSGKSEEPSSLNWEVHNYLATKQKIYTEEFKREAVRLVETSEKSIFQLARDLGVNASSLKHWCMLYGQNSALKRKGHTEQFKREAVRLVETSEKSIRQLARDLDVSDGTLRQWRKLFGQNSVVKRKKSYTEEFKREAVRLVETSEKSIRQLARDLDVSDGTLRRWRKLFGQNSVVKRKKSYTEEFRQEAVRLMETSEKSMLQLARDFGTNYNTLNRWRKLYGQYSATNQTRYTEEFKREAVRLVETSGKSIKHLVRELGVIQRTLYQWRRLYSQNFETKYKRYPEEFKREAVRLMETSGKSFRQLARDLDIHRVYLRRWQELYGRRG